MYASLVSKPFEEKEKVLGGLSDTMHERYFNVVGIGGLVVTVASNVGFVIEGPNYLQISWEAWGS